MQLLRQLTVKSRFAAVVALTVGLLTVLAQPFLWATLKSQSQFYGYEVNQPIPALAAALASTSTGPSEAVQGSYAFRLVMFGYLGCERICHTQLVDMLALSRQLNSDQIRYTYISMDPTNDGARLGHYLATLGGVIEPVVLHSVAEAQQLALSFRAPFHYRRGNTDRLSETVGYLNHPGFWFVTDAEHNLRLIYPFEAVDLHAVAQDIKALLRKDLIST